MNEAELLEKTTKCIRCGFCLEACPTFVVTGQETESPRGRIYLVRSAIEGELEWNEQVRDHLDTCLGCRACETACPSGVEYGSILEFARDKLEPGRPATSRITRKVLLSALTTKERVRSLIRLSKLSAGRKVPRLLSWLLGSSRPAANKLSPEQPNFPYIASPKHPQRTVYLLEGCVMGAAFESAHRATINLLHHHDCKVLTPKTRCCGALHLHNGDMDTARTLAKQVISKFDNDCPVIIHSAGCGSAMKEYHALFDSGSAEYEKAASFSKRVRDITEYLCELEFRSPKQTITKRVAYHDACHLAHGQGIRKQPRDLISAIPGVELVELDDAERCCGSAGIFNLTQPELAAQLLEMKWRAVERANPDVVVTGNPGCLAWLRQAASEKKSAVRVLHTAEFLWKSYEGRA